MSATAAAREEIEKAKCDARWAKYEKSTFEQSLRHAFRPNVMLSDNELAYIQSVYPGEILPQNRSPSTHGRARALTELCNMYIKQYSEKTPGALHIGPNLGEYRKSYKPGDHSCILIDNGRDEARHNHAIFNFERQTNIYSPETDEERTRELRHFDDRVIQAVRDRCDNHVLCTNGAQRCTRPAPLAFAVHSLYDITSAEIIEIFTVHDIQQLTAFVYLFPMIEVLNEFFCPDSGFWYKIHEAAWFDTPTRDHKLHRPKKITFGFSDANNNPDMAYTYTHLYENYHALVFSQVIHGPDFAVMKEVQMKFGFLAEVRYSRIRLGLPRTMVRVSYGLEKYVLIPKLHVWIENGYNWDPSTDSIMVDRSKFFQLIKFAGGRSDDDIGFCKVHQYGRSIEAAVTVGARTVIQTWLMDEFDFDHVVQFAYIYAMIERFKRSKNVGMAIKEATNQLANQMDFFSRNWQAIKDYLSTVPLIKGLFANPNFTGSRICNVLHDFNHRDVWFDSRKYPSEVFLRTRSSGYYECLEMQIERSRKDQTFLIPPWAIQPREQEEAQPAAAATDSPMPPEFTIIPPNSELPKPIEQFQSAMRAYLNSIQLKRETAIETKFANALWRQVQDLNFEDVTKRFLNNSNLQIINGGPGTGKTTYALNNLIETDSVNVVVVPTRDLKKDWEDRLKRADLAQFTKVYTFESFLHHNLPSKDVDVLIVDESFLLGAPYCALADYVSNASKTYLVGDPLQIGYIDFKKVVLQSDEEYIALKTYLPFFEQRVLNYCYRCPRDVVALLNSNFGFNLWPISEVEKSIVIMDGEPPSSPEKSCFSMVFTQSGKKLVTPTGGVGTVHETQGSTKPNVVLTVTSDAIPLIQKSKEHLIVAITRHTESLIIYSTDESGKAYINDALGDLTLITDAHAGFVPHDADCPERVAPVSSSIVASECQVDTNIDTFDPPSVVQVFTKMLKPQNTTLCKVNNTCLPDTKATIRINTDQFTQKESHKTVRRIIGPYFGRTFKSSDRVETLRTLIKRYCNRLDKMNETEANITAERLWNVYNKNCIKEWSTITEDDLTEAYKEFCESVKEKKQEFLMDPPELMNKQFFTDFILKDMIKAKVGPDQIGKDKAGQGIGAWSKQINPIFCIWFRAAVKALNRSFNPENVFANGWDDARFYHYMEAKVLNMDPSEYESMENDFTEYDSNQKKCHVKFTSKIWLRLGMPAHLVEQWCNMRHERRMVARGFASTTVQDRKDSGEPATLQDNSELGRAIVFDLLEITELLLALGKGDDILIIARKIRFSENYKKIIKNHGMSTKFKRSKVMQFCSRFLTNKGFLIDPVSRALKLLSRVFLNDQAKLSDRLQEFHSYQEAVREWLKSYTTQEVLETAKQSALVYYRDEFPGITLEDINQCVYFLYSFANPTFTYKKFCGYTYISDQIIMNEYKA